VWKRTRQVSTVRRWRKYILRPITHQCRHRDLLQRRYRYRDSNPSEER
jgi:hypothetical protein